MADEAIAKLIGEEDGQTMGFRVLLEEGKPPRVEVSVQGKGKFFGQDSTSMTTYWSEVRPDGTLFGEGAGLAFLKDGSTAAFRGSGVGTQKGPMGPQHWRATLYYRNATGKLAPLNEHPVIVEFEVSENWTTHAKIYEWK